MILYMCMQEKNAGEGLRLTRLEVARVLRERNEYKEKSLSLLEQVRSATELNRTPHRNTFYIFLCSCTVHVVLFLLNTYILFALFCCRMSDELYLFKKSKKSSRWVDL